MIIYDEPAERYHAREAVSAGFLWDIIKPDGCPAQAFHESVFNPEQPPEENTKEFNIGKAEHLLVLEGSAFAERTTLIAYNDYKTQVARDLRDQAYVDGRTPLLPKDYKLVCAMHDALRKSEASELLFGEGRNEVSYTWESGGPSQYDPLESPIACKARADRIVSGAIFDLKTAPYASPSVFERAMDRDGHHLRAAWYLDGWMEQVEFVSSYKGKPNNEKIFGKPDYAFIVVAKTPPHLVSIFTTGWTPDRPGWFHIKEESLDWGRTLYRKALAEVRRCRESGWTGYGRKGEKVNNVSLPAYRLNMLYSQERSGEFDHAEIDQDIPY